MPLRVMPHVGQAVSVRYLDATAAGIVNEVHDEGRSLLVLTEEGESVRFTLSPATGTFTTGGAGFGARLIFGDPALSRA
jgi:hypothetical protein